MVVVKITTSFKRWRLANIQAHLQKNQGEARSETFYFCNQLNTDKKAECRNLSKWLYISVLHHFMKKHSWNLICQHWHLLTGTTEQRMWPSFRTNNPPCSCEMGLFFLLSLSYHVTLQLTGPAPSWHPGGSDSPASLWEKGGEREVWEGREEEGMNQNTIKGTEWPFWELKARWLEREGGRGREREREREPERVAAEVIGPQPLLAVK